MSHFAAPPPASALRRCVHKSFSLAGLTLTNAGMKCLVSRLRAGGHTLQEADEILAQVVVAPELTKGGDSIVEGEVIEGVLDRLGRDAEVGPGGLQVIDAFDTPRYTYVPARNKFALADGPAPSLHGGPKDRVSLLRDRFNVARQRVLRTDAFSSSRPGSLAASFANLGPQGSQGDLRLTTIDSLLGVPGQTVYVLGMLRRAGGEGGKERDELEDLTGAVALDTSAAEIHAGLVTEGCFVIVEGTYEDETLHAIRLGFPPPEPKVVSHSYLGKLDLFGGRRDDVSQEELLEAETRATDAMFVVLSDVHLDSPRVMRALRVLFEGYGSMPTPPLLFVLMGNFTSKPLGLREDAVRTMSAHFDRLADLICEFPAIAEGSHFVVMPGPRDLTAGAALPRPRVPRVFTRGFESRLNATFTSSVARVRYFTQEIVISRNDLLSEMRRNTVLRQPHEDEDMSELLVKTVFDQAHLAPLPLYTTPIHWGYDHALRLFPLPDVCVLADRQDQYEWEYEGCLAVNPGPFHADLAFVVYQPAQRTTQYSRIPPEAREDEEYIHIAEKGDGDDESMGSDDEHRASQDAMDVDEADDAPKPKKAKVARQSKISFGAAPPPREPSPAGQEEMEETEAPVGHESPARRDSDASSDSGDQSQRSAASLARSIENRTQGSVAAEDAVDEEESRGEGGNLADILGTVEPTLAESDMFFTGSDGDE